MSLQWNCRETYFELCWSRDPYEDSFDQNVYRKLRLENQFRIKCECVLCTDDEWTNLFDEVSLEQSPLWKDAITPVTMTVNTFRNLPRGTMEQYVNRAIKFLKMYSRFHPLRGTMDVQWGLIIMWDLFTTRFWIVNKLTIFWFELQCRSQTSIVWKKIIPLWISKHNS